MVQWHGKYTGSFRISLHISQIKMSGFDLEDVQLTAVRLEHGEPDSDLMDNSFLKLFFSAEFASNLSFLLKWMFFLIHV